MTFELAIICAIGLLATWGLARVFLWLALRADILSHPNQRSAHSRPTPTAAGISFILVFSVMSFVVTDSLGPVWLAPLLVAGIGFADDLSPLSVVPRSIGYVAASAWAIWWIGFPSLNVGGLVVDLGIFGLVFGFASLLWLQNLYNFMDGIDAIATAEAIFVCVGAVLIAGDLSSPLPLLLASACLGFAFINWPPAKVFMGDAGSGFLGLALGIFTLSEVLVSVWVWVILLGYFLTDACLTILVRLLRGEKVYEAHNLHAYQHLARRFGASAALFGVLAVNLVWLLPVAWLAHGFPDYAVYLVIFAFIPLLVCQFLFGAGQQQPRLNALMPVG